MTCLFHPAAPAEGECATCRRPFCAGCLVEFLGQRVCGPCRDQKLTQVQAPRPGGIEGFLEDTARQFSQPHRNELAQGALILGVLGLIPCTGRFAVGPFSSGLLLGPLAVVLGLLGLRACRRDPEMPGRKMAVAAICLGAVGTVLWWALFLGLGGLRV